MHRFTFSPAKLVARVRAPVAVLGLLVGLALVAAPQASAQTSTCYYSPPGSTLNALSPANSIVTSTGRRDTFVWWSDLITVDVASPPTPLASNRVLVRFGTRTSWDKEVVARDLCLGTDVGRLFARGGTTNPSSLLVPRSTGPGTGADTLVLRKPGFWGIWIDSAYFTPSSFWTAYGGRSITITWWSD